MTPDGKIVSAQGSMSPALSCAECEEHLADFLDGSLDNLRDRKSAVEAHLAACAECAEFACDAQAAMAFTGRAAAVDVPAGLLPQILAEITTGPSRVLVQASLAERILGRWIRPILQPRFALGVAMGALSIAMIPGVWTSTQELGTIAPARIWTLAENRVYRTFDRAMKGYEDLALISSVQNQLDEWTGDSFGPSDGSSNAGALNNDGSIDNDSAPGAGARRQ